MTQLGERSRPEEKAKLSAWCEAIEAMMRAGVDGTANAEIPAHGLNPDRVRDAMHVPDDAGALRDSLVDILSRMPDGYGRWIGVHRGWYPLVAKLNYDLHPLDANYVVYQVKQKMGKLCYYAEPTGEAVRDRFDGLIRDAELRSASICEECGSPGRMHRRWDYLATLCTACAAAAPVVCGWRFMVVNP
jgi:hypothetical protein